MASEKSGAIVLFSVSLGFSREGFEESPAQ
jgi:hypothetical protein